MRERIQLVVALAVCIGAGYALLNREGDDTASLLNGGGGTQGQGATGPGPAVPPARGLDAEAATAITDAVSLTASNQEPCDYYTETALATFEGPGRPLDPYDACLAAVRRPRIEASAVRLLEIRGRGGRASARYEAAGRRGTARLVDVGGEWLLSRPLP